MAWKKVDSDTYVKTINQSLSRVSDFDTHCQMSHYLSAGRTYTYFNWTDKNNENIATSVYGPYGSEQYFIKVKDE